MWLAGERAAGGHALVLARVGPQRIAGADLDRAIRCVAAFQRAAPGDLAVGGLDAEDARLARPHGPAAAPVDQDAGLGLGHLVIAMQRGAAGAFDRRDQRQFAAQAQASRDPVGGRPARRQRVAQGDVQVLARRARHLGFAVVDAVQVGAGHACGQAAQGAHLAQVRHAGHYLGRHIQIELGPGKGGRRAAGRQCEGAGQGGGGKQGAVSHGHVRSGDANNNDRRARGRAVRTASTGRLYSARWDRPRGGPRFVTGLALNTACQRPSHRGGRCNGLNCRRLPAGVSGARRHP
jgi:hypothetical protein